MFVDHDLERERKQLENNVCDYLTMKVYVQSYSSFQGKFVVHDINVESLSEIVLVKVRHANLTNCEVL